MKTFLSTIIFTFISIGQAQALEGIYPVAGYHDKHGTYSGQLELRSRRDGKFDAIRVITYDNFKFENLKVQEVWTGTAEQNGEAIKISYIIRRADFLNSVGDLRRAPEDFLHPQEVILNYVKAPGSYFTLAGGVYTEYLVNTVPTARGTQPLWKSERFVDDATGESMPAIGSLPVLILRLSVIPAYRQQPFAVKYADREEFRSARQYVVYDSTDYDFYQSHKDIVRVVNKYTDTISLVEAITRRNAFAPTLTEKAQYFDKDMKDNHINEMGMFTRYGTPDGDSALWTGMYAGSQAMRYLATGEPEALENFKKTLKGMMFLMDVTQDPKEFARYVQVYREGQGIPNNFVRGTGAYSNYIYIPGGNNDMYKGLVHTFVWAYKVLPASETELWAQIKNHLERMPELNAVQEKNGNKIPAYGLKALATGGSTLKEYKRAIAKDTWPDAWGLENGFYWGGIADFSGVNLTMVSLVTNILLAEMLQQPDAVKKFKKSLMANWQTYSPIRKDFLTVAAYTFAYSDKDMFPDDFDQEKWNKSFSRSLWSLRDIPSPRTSIAVTYDYRLRPDWCLSAWPDLPWKRLTKNVPPWEYHMQGAYDYPIFESMAFGSTYIWKDGAFAFTGSTSGGLPAPSGDYLYVYWMARLGKMIAP